jgi:hypothetical protein
MYKNSKIDQKSTQFFKMTLPKKKKKIIIIIIIINFFNKPPSRQYCHCRPLSGTKMTARTPPVQRSHCHPATATPRATRTLDTAANRGQDYTRRIQNTQPADRGNIPVFIVKFYVFYTKNRKKNGEKMAKNGENCIKIPLKWGFGKKKWPFGGVCKVVLKKKNGEILKKKKKMG